MLGEGGSPYTNNISMYIGYFSYLTEDHIVCMNSLFSRSRC
jgi:hypothetical protein